MLKLRCNLRNLLPCLSHASQSCIPRFPFSLIRTVTSQGLPPRQFPTSGYVTLDPLDKIEEETLPFYKPENYYPVSIGEVFGFRYQVVSKLGYGTSSTVWLCRDLREGNYYTLKLCAKSESSDREIAISKHLEQSVSETRKRMLRLVLDSFDVVGPEGRLFVCLIYQPLGMSFTEFQDLLPDQRFSKDLIQRSTQLILIALSSMHESGAVHTDISPNNILQGVRDSSILSKIEEDELKRPIARKVLSDRSIHYSRPMPVCSGLPVVSDLGEARFGKEKYYGDIMPGIYRAPEVILGMEWDYKVDIWSIGNMVWDLAESHHLFFAKENRTLSDEQHLAEMVSLMGPPPQEFLMRSKRCDLFWDAEGNWKGSICIPEQTFELRELHFSGEDKVLFLNFLRRIFRWLPEERPTAEELAYDDFLMQPIMAKRDQ
ncbi:kinase-like protein [Aspergillus eucalypticola CBS 122712]|uniref:Kinase-like protein n=1 Tax=Aspergillus eucalypticola (strain CBS 122712 / IBT 29274) TaxID=1448314 RepID=A0A317VX48_ASPEC|nr:kinase-like protein [Aspergillus eucalypticola CBS 122712]PWY77891.1 kinase-like protein [Aspergillus eucalypticola CBS 122712]